MYCYYDTIDVADGIKKNLKKTMTEGGLNLLGQVYKSLKSTKILFNNKEIAILLQYIIRLAKGYFTNASY